MTSLSEAFTKRQAALEPLGTEIGRGVLAIWTDRVRYRNEPLATSALTRLAEVVDQLLLDSACASSDHGQ